MLDLPWSTFNSKPISLLFGNALIKPDIKAPISFLSLPTDPGNQVPTDTNKND